MKVDKDFVDAFLIFHLATNISRTLIKDVFMIPAVVKDQNYDSRIRYTRILHYE